MTIQMSLSNTGGCWRWRLAYKGSGDGEMVFSGKAGTPGSGSRLRRVWGALLGLILFLAAIVGLIAGLHTLGLI